MLISNVEIQMSNECQIPKSEFLIFELWHLDFKYPFNSGYGGKGV
jgi:hypothetical protein